MTINILLFSKTDFHINL